MKASSSRLHPLAAIDVPPEIRALPKTDIHLHAESELRVDQLLARRGRHKQYDWRGWVQRLMTEVPPGMPRMQSIHGDFDRDRYAEFMEQPDYIEARFHLMMEEAAADGAVYIEVRLGGGTLANDNVLPCFRAAERRVQQQYGTFFAEPIITWAPVVGAEKLESQVRWSMEAATQGLAGVDFHPFPYDGDADFQAIYRLAERAAAAGLGITCHVAEFTPHNVRQAMEIPGLTRLGHALQAPAVPGALDEMARKGITVEVSLSCNVVLGAVTAYEEHPVRQFVDASVPVTICSDDPLRVCTTIGREYAIARRLGFTIDELRQFTENGVQAAFTSAERNSALRQVFEARPEPKQGNPDPDAFRTEPGMRRKDR